MCVFVIFGRCMYQKIYFILSYETYFLILKYNKFLSDCIIHHICLYSYYSQLMLDKKLLPWSFMSLMCLRLCFVYTQAYVFLSIILFYVYSINFASSLSLWCCTCAVFKCLVCRLFKFVLALFECMHCTICIPFYCETNVHRFLPFFKVILEYLLEFLCIS